MLKSDYLKKYLDIKNGYMVQNQFGGNNDNDNDNNIVNFIYN